VSHGGGELGDVHRAGGVDHDDRTQPQRTRWLGPEFLVAAGVIEVTWMTVAGAGPVPGPGQLKRNGAVHLDEAARKGTCQGERVVEPGAVEHRPGAGAGDAQHHEHGGLAEELRGGHRLWPAKLLHEGFLDLIFGQQRQAKLGR
jgi:hypothetical protein